MFGRIPEQENQSETLYRYICLYVYLKYSCNFLICDKYTIFSRYISLFAKKKFYFSFFSRKDIAQSGQDMSNNNIFYIFFTPPPIVPSQTFRVHLALRSLIGW